MSETTDSMCKQCPEVWNENIRLRQWRMDAQGEMQTQRNTIEHLRKEKANYRAKVDQLEAENERLAASDTALGNLLAVIHRDGGHYRTEHGTAQAAEDAQEIVIQLRTEIDRLTTETGKLRKLLTWALRPEAHAALMAEYARAGKVTEGCESNIPY
jgi:DNA repair exonuclease SbcCD ATPase subunit